MKRRLALGIVLIGIITCSLTIKTPTTTSFDNENQITVSQILAFTPHEPISITHDDNFTDYGFEGNGTDISPYIIEGYDITTTSENGIFINGTSKYFIIRDCYIDADIYGIRIKYVAYGTASVINNICTNNNYDGITLVRSFGINLINNTCNNNDWHGIYLNTVCDYATLINNTCNNNFHGINLGASYDCTIANNTCNNNWHGIYLDNSHRATLTNNTCKNCNNDGIYLSFTDFCLVTYNLLQENEVHEEDEGYGIYLDSNSDSNTIHHNTFVDNNLGGTSQAYDSGTNSIWYDIATDEGNYWSDWSGTGNYSIDGSANAEDPYPLDEPVIPPIISEFSIDINILILVIILGVVIIPQFLITRKGLKNN